MPTACATDEESLAQAAADWVVQLSADDDHEREQARVGFEAWKRADPRHAAAAAGMERFIEQARALQGSPATRAALHAALDAPTARAPKAGRLRRAAVPLALFLAIAIPAAAALRAFPPTEMLADLRTPTGEQRTQRLADGSRLQLGSGSAVNVDLAEDQRRIQLLSGEVLVDVARDPARPFVVDTAHGRIRALGTRFILRREADSTLLTMLESTTAVRAGNGAELRVSTGGQARLSAHGVERLADIQAGMVEDAFVHRRLLVQGRPLSEVLDELSRHRGGVIRYEREAIAALRVSAVLPLDDTDRALQLLVNSFPQLRLRTLTPWVVLVDAPR